MNWLLIFVRVSIALEHFAPEKHLLIFVSSGLAILPLAAWMGRATEHLAERRLVGCGSWGDLKSLYGQRGNETRQHNAQESDGHGQQPRQHVAWGEVSIADGQPGDEGKVDALPNTPSFDQPDNDSQQDLQ
jgi:hypothetical protein